MKHRSTLARRALVAAAGATIFAGFVTGGVASATVTVGNSTCDLAGAGTAASPYTIANVTELQEVSDCNGVGFAFYKLTASFALTPPASGAPAWNDGASGGWTPIANGSNFSGVFDGNGKALTGLTIDRFGSNNQGLFAGLSHAAVFNLSVGGTVKGDTYVGGLAGRSEYSNIRDVTSSVALTGDGNYVGGIVGEASYSNLDQLTASGVVQVDNSAQVNVNYYGGIAGRTTNASLSNLTATGVVNGNRLVSGSNYSTVSNIGGVVGYVSSGGGIDTVTRSGAVSGRQYVGGVVGQMSDLSGTNFTSSSAITASGDYSGGLVGYLDYGSLEASTSSGAVTSTGDYTGGIAGEITYGAAIINGKATGAISSSGSYVGGVVGYIDDGTVTKSSATGAITITATADNIGGLVGQINDGSLTGSTTSGAMTCGTAASSNLACTEMGGAVGKGRWAHVHSVTSSRSITTNSTSHADGGSSAIGGLAGYLEYSNVSRSSSSGAVSVTNGAEVGGLVGDTKYVTIVKSSASGNVTVSNLYSSWQVATGGLVGAMMYNLAIVQSSSTGNVTASGYANSVGGLVGIQWRAPTLLVTDSFARGNVTGGSNVGGLVGLLDDSGSQVITLKNVYASGTVTAPSKSKAATGGAGAVSSNVVTITWTGSDHYFEVGDTVAVTGCSNTALNGTGLSITAVYHGTNGSLSYAKTTSDTTGVTGCSVTGTGKKDSIAVPATDRKVSAHGVLFVSGSTTVSGAVQKTAAVMKVTSTMTATQKANVLKTYTNVGFSSTKWAVSPTKNGGYAYLK